MGFITKYGLCALIFMLFFFKVFSSNGSIEYGNKARKLLKPYSDYIEKIHGLTPYGSGGSMQSDIKYVIESFYSDKELTISESRELFIECVEELLRRFNENKEIRPYLHDFPFTITNAKLRILFVDKNFNAIRNGKIAGIFSSGDNICYEKYDEDKKRVIIFLREPYDQAKELILKEKHTV